MKVTVEFENEEEEKAILAEIKNYGIVSKEAISELLSDNLIYVLRSPYIRLNPELLKTRKERLTLKKSLVKK